MSLLLLAATLVPPDDATVTIGGITWYTDYDHALKAARKANKPLFLHFGENPG